MGRGKVGRDAGLVLVTVSLLLVLPPQAIAQDRAPPVVFEEHAIERYVQPLGEPRQIEVTAWIGCETPEVPQTLTRARFQKGEVPGGVNLIFAPREVINNTEPVDCTDPEATFPYTTTASVALTQEPAAFQPLDVPIGLEVRKQLPESGEGSTYGPYNATLHLTPGYFNLYNVRLDEKIAQVRAGGTAVYPIEVDNFSNGETRFTIEASEPVPDGVQVAFEPTELVLASRESGTLEMRVTGNDTGRLVNEVVSVQAVIDSVSTHPEAKPLSNQSTIATQTQFRGSVADNAPGPGVALIALAVGLAAVLAVRARWR